MKNIVNSSYLKSQRNLRKYRLRLVSRLVIIITNYVSQAGPKPR